MTCSAILIGTGGRGAVWCYDLLPPHVEDGRLDVVAAVDVDADALSNAQDPDGLGLSEGRCYTDAETALAEHDPDVCFVSVPSPVHEDMVTAATEYDADILSEKPIANTMAASARIAERVEQADVRMGVMMNHRFDHDKATLRRLLQNETYGPLDYLVYRFTCNCRNYGEWGADWKYSMDEPLLVGGAVHHLDILASLADAPPETVYARTRNPPWSDFQGNGQALVTVTFENGVDAVYEGSKTNAAGLNGWGNDYIRAECRDGTLELDRRNLTAYEYDPDASPMWGGPDGDAGEEISLDTDGRSHGVLVVDQFLDWLDGGEPMPTRLETNLRSTALLFAAAESGRTGQPIDVTEFLADARADAAETAAADDD